MAYALGGLGSVVVAILIARLLDRAEGYFLPSIVTGSLTIVLCAVSLVVKRPLVAWTSYITRRWPLAWYWHPRVRPAYTEVTIAWTIFFAVRLAVQFLFFREAHSRRVGNRQRADGVACHGRVFGAELPVWAVAVTELARSKRGRI